jgi:hypothetical protein
MLFDSDIKSLNARADVGDSFGAVSALFSGLALVGIVATIYLQQRDSVSQAREANETRKALVRAADANIRALHVQLIEMSMRSPDLAEVWPTLARLESEQERRQFQYVNLILSHHYLAWVTEGHSSGLVMAGIEHLMESEIVRDFWRTVREARLRGNPPGTPEAQFDHAIDAAFNRRSTPPA